MRFSTLTLLAVSLLLCIGLPGIGQTSTSSAIAAPAHRNEVDDDPRVIIEIGAATSWGTTGGAAIFAPNLAAETTPIENVLELEVGTSPFYARDATEWDTDLLFKKPWKISPKAEFMLGIGPEWVYVRQSRRTSNSVAAEIAGDFMFWPNGRHHFGWYLEPAYDYNFAAGHQQSIGMSTGLLIGIARRHE
jgi:hypothetical protein